MVKKKIYAAAGIPNYWILNLVEQLVEVYTEPLPSGEYGSKRSFTFEEPISVQIGETVVGKIEIASDL